MSVELTVAAVVDQPIKGSVIRKILSCDLRRRGGRSRRGPRRNPLCEAVVVKENVLELISHSSDAPYVVEVSQHVFGTIKDAAVFTRRRQGGVEDDYLVCLSDSGLMSFVILVEEEDEGSGKKGNLDEDLVIVDEEPRGKPLRFESALDVMIANEGLDYRDLGAKIAVDPFSRAIAVSAHQNIVRIWETRKEKELDDDGDFILDEDGITFYEEGVIWALAFLYPEDKDEILLAVTVLSVHGTLSIVIYDYSSENDPELARVSTIELKYGDFLTQFVAMPDYPGYIAATTETEILFIYTTDTPTKSTDRFVWRHPIPQSLGFSKTASLASGLVPAPPSTPGSSSLYLATDDGRLYLLQLAHNMRLTTIYLAHRNPTSSLHLLSSSSGRDLLALIGDMAEGELLVVDHTAETLKRRAALPCSSPTLDFALARHPEAVAVGDGFAGETAFLTGGVDDKGVVRGIRRGIRVALGGESDEFDGALDVWAVGGDLLVIGFVGATRVMRLSGSVMEECEVAGLVGDVPSVFCGEVEGGFVVQVHARGIAVGRVVGEGTSGAETTLMDWPSSLMCPKVGRVSGYIVVGFQGCYICIFSVDPKTPLRPVNTMEVEPFDPNGDEIKAMLPESDKDLFTPNSFDMIYQGRQAYLLCGMRNGGINVYTWRFNNDPELPECYLTLVDTAYPGKRPVVMVPMQDQSFSIALSERPWKAQIGRFNQLVLEPLLMDKTLTAAALFNVGDTFTTFVTLYDGMLALMTVDGEVIYAEAVVGIQETPRRVVFDPVTKTLIVATVTREGEGRIKVVHPDTGKELAKEKLAEGEICHSLAVWNVKEGKRYICVGTYGYQEPNTTERKGRVLVFNVKTGESRHKPQDGQLHYKIRKLGEFKLPKLVILMESSYLIAASGDTLYQLKIDAATRTLVAGASIELRWPIQSLSTWGNRILVSSIKDSVSVYLYNTATKSFEFTASDSVSRPTSDCVPLSRNLYIAVDKTGTLCGLSHPPFGANAADDAMIELSLENVFSFHLGEIALRVHVGTLIDGAELTRTARFWDAPWWEPHGEAKGSGGIVYATSVVGGVFTIRGMREVESERLKRLEHILRRAEGSRPLLGNDHEAYRSRHVQSRGVIDGEMVRAYYKLTKTEQARVYKEWRASADDKRSEKEDWVLLDMFRRL
ncbi:hypothetical protein HK101_010472 [Irineochytrium annulatum]|nr:hypothetical protein HK101_010472 [Irineochytrium annulatum]